MLPIGTYFALISFFRSLGVSLSLKKCGESSSLRVRTSRESTTVRDNVSVIFGAAVAKELLDVRAEDELLGLKVEGLVSNANYNAKKLNFLLFINHRLVGSYVMKRL